MGRTVIAVAVATLTSCAPAVAQDASRWDGDTRTAVRLIAGAKASDGLRAGIEIRLKPGWITYWRYPGDAGVPPRFDFQDSDNLRSASVQWPAPVRVTKDGVVSISYEGNVVFPLRILPEDPKRPVILRVKIDYGVCEKLCVPAQASAELTLTGAPSANDSTLAAAEARVPSGAPLGANDPLAIKSVRREAAKPPRIVVDVTAPEGADVDLFAEGPSADWALPVPSPIAGEPGGARRFTFDLDGAPPGASYDGAVFKLTAVAGGRSIEVTTKAD